MTTSTKHIIQGEYAASGDPNVVIATLLGSCVSACLWDPVAKVGGMNHMVLPTGNDVDTGSAYHGVNAMELLINEIIKLGGDRRRLEGKLFGGARMVAGLSDVGARNTEFALDFFEREGILCQSKSLGGESARKVQFVPTSGKARQMLVAATEVKEPVQKPKPKPTEDVELF